MFMDTVVGGIFFVPHFVVVFLVDSLFPYNLCWFIFEKANEVHDEKDTEKRTFKTKQYKQN